jgi:hypothetical protein
VAQKKTERNARFKVPKELFEELLRKYFHGFDSRTKKEQAGARTILRLALEGLAKTLRGKKDSHVLVPLDSKDLSFGDVIYLIEKYDVIRLPKRT